MRSPGVVVMGVVAVAVVGYAIYTLAGAEGPAPERASPASDAHGEDEPPPTDRSSRAGGLGVKPAPVSKATQRRGGPPPRPTPSVSLDRARSDFQAILDEIDEVEQAGRPLTTQEWTELYRRGNEALLPLQQHLSWGEPGQGDEIQRANEQLRAKLRAIEPGAPAPAAP